MAKKEVEKERLNFNSKEYNFDVEDLSDEAKAQYGRANQLAMELMQMERASSEKRFVINNYIKFVVSELENEEDVDEENKNVDSKEVK